MDAFIPMAAVFIASGVEAVEVVTIALALGLTRGWRSTLIGLVAAVVVLALATALLGSTLLQIIDVHVLEIIIGFLLLVFGLQWLRKSILRSSGFKALNDEDALFREESAQARAAPLVRHASLDWFAFTVAFKGMLLEGLEIIFIVLTIGAAGGRLDQAIIAATAAAVLVGIVAIFVRRPLSQVPENTLKFVVGVLLTTFGTYWAGEGVGIAWLGGDWALFWILGTYLAASYIAIRVLSQSRAVEAEDARA